MTVVAAREHARVAVAQRRGLLGVVRDERHACPPGELDADSASRSASGIVCQISSDVKVRIGATMRTSAVRIAASTVCAPRREGESAASE